MHRLHAVFALYAWRQLLGMGIKARFAVGRSGRKGGGHAWVTLEKDGRLFLCEPLACAFESMPRIAAVNYKPEISVEYSRGKLSYYAHREMDYTPSASELLSLFGEWFPFWLYRQLLLAVARWLSSPFRWLARPFLRRPARSEHDGSAR